MTDTEKDRAANAQTQSSDLSVDLEEHNTNYKKIANSRDADAMLHFQELHDADVPEISPEQERMLSRKVCWYVISLTALVNLVLYMDKATLSYASILGFWEDTGLDQNKYNNVNTIFYVGYVLGQIPGNYLIQVMPVGKFLLFLVSMWCVITFLTCVVKTYGGVMGLRFCLGLVEAVVIPIINTTLGQFLNANEKAASGPLFFSTCLGVTIPTGFIAYGVLHIHSSLANWKIFMLLLGGLTFLLAIIIAVFYPDNPSTARFLSTEEKIWTIRRVQRTTNSVIEQKVFKKHQLIEALKDPISWMFLAYFLLLNLANNLPYQQNLLFTEMGGISPLDSTLVSVASGGFSVICSLIAAYFLGKYKDISAYSTCFWTLPSLVGSICAAALPWSNKIGILANLTMASPVFGVPWIIMFSWAVTSCSGYTKKMTRNAMTMIGYGIGNIISPQLWQEKDKPRYLPAWIVQIVLSFFLAPLLSLVIHRILKKRNIGRLSNVKDVKGIVADEDGNETEVNIAALDLTDLENKSFLYPL